MANDFLTMPRIKSQLKNWRKVKITRDSGANFKLLKNLANENYIEIFDVLTENETCKVKNKILPTAIFGYSEYGACELAGAGVYEEILEVIGKENFGDAVKLDTHIRNNFDYFITEDNDFLSKREVLKEKFGVQILTPEELKRLCQK